MSAANSLVVRTLPVAVRGILLEQPGWTRLEPQQASGDPTPGLECRVHDPLWVLTRQWQFGEFQGEDAGTPLAVRLDTTSARVTAWRPGDLQGQSGAGVRPWSADEPLDPAVEREPLTSRGAGMRQRAEAGGLLIAALGEAGFDARAQLLAACPLLGPGDATQLPRLFQTLSLSCPDAEKAALSLEASGAAVPAWLAGAPAAAQAAARSWLAWYRAKVAPLAATAPESWIPQRLEHRFSLRVGRGAGQHVLTAPAYDGEAVDWHIFDHAPGAQLSIPGEPAGAPETLRQISVVASPLRYAGMPADRMWQFEDGSINLGALEVQPHDLARLCFVEFAMLYGNDWFVVPVDVDDGSLTLVTKLTYTTTFGETRAVPPADDTRRSGRFRLFELAVTGRPDSTLPGLFIPPAALGQLEGSALEDVVFLRDEGAHMAWAVEATVQSPSGDPRSRRNEPSQTPPAHTLLPGADLFYTLETTVPPNWIPMVPVPTTGHGGFVLQKGTMTDHDQAMGQVLAPTPYLLQEEEVPREGVRVRRVPVLARTGDGRRLRWVARRISVGRGEGSSGLAFDSATR